MFERVVKYGMNPRYVIPLLTLSQSDFLSTLTSGIERVYQRKITRKELAEMAGFSTTAIYSYTATPSARDYRTISDDMRIAAIWRVSCALGRFRGKYTIDGQPVTLHIAAEMLGYASKQSLSQAITREGIAPGGDISHLKNAKPKRIFIINGQEVALNQAAGLLGYTATGLRYWIEKLEIHDGSDISHLVKRKREKNTGTSDD